MVAGKKTVNKKRKNTIGRSRIVLSVLAIMIGVVLGAADGLLSGKIQLSGKQIQQERIVDEFNKISMRGVGNLFIKRGSDTRLFVNADEALMDSITTFVADGTLFIEFDRQGSFLRSLRLSVSEIDFTVETPGLTKLVASGAASVQTDGTGIVGESFMASLSGASSAALNLDVDSLIAESSGSGKFIITGRANSQDVTLSGTSKYFAKDATSSVATIRADGSNEVELNVTDELTVETGGTGVLRYRGEPVINSKGPGVLNISRIID